MSKLDVFPFNPYKGMHIDDVIKTPAGRKIAWDLINKPVKDDDFKNWVTKRNKTWAEKLQAYEQPNVQSVLFTQSAQGINVQSDLTPTQQTQQVGNISFASKDVSELKIMLKVITDQLDQLVKNTARNEIQIDKVFDE